MGRLVDVHKFFCSECECDSEIGCTWGGTCFVREFPVAYDVDKTIEELKSKSFITGEESNDDGCYTDGRFSVVPLDVAIEIVKRGGV